MNKKCPTCAGSGRRMAHACPECKGRRTAEYIENGTHSVGVCRKCKGKGTIHDPSICHDCKGIGFVRDPGTMVRRNDPITSVEAAESVDQPRIRKQVYETLRDYGPMTDEELVEQIRFLVAGPGNGYKAANVSPSGARTRRSELVEEGLVHDTGETRTTKSGRRAIVWGIVE